MWCPGPQFVQQPSATADAQGQQAQDAVTINLAMWRIMSTMLQQQQHVTFPGYGPGTLRTPLQQNAGTSLGMPRCPGVMATPRFPAQTTASWMPLIAAHTALPTAVTNQDATSVLPQHSGKKQPPLQDVQDSDLPNADS